MTDRKPTIRELQKLIGHEAKSVAYNNSRSVLNNLDTPVLSYGVGYAGFIAIYKNKNKQLNAVNYSVKHMEGHQEGSFYVMTVEQADKRIRTCELFAKKETMNLRNMPAKEIYRRPVVGKIKFIDKTYNDKWTESNNLTREYNIEQFKKGTYCGITNRFHHKQMLYENELLSSIDNTNAKIKKGEAIYIKEEDYQDILKAGKTLEKIPHNVNRIIFENTVPKKVVEEIRTRKMIKKMEA